MVADRDILIVKQDRTGLATVAFRLRAGAMANDPDNAHRRNETHLAVTNIISVDARPAVRERARFGNYSCASRVRRNN